MKGFLTIITVIMTLRGKLLVLKGFVFVAELWLIVTPSVMAPPIVQGLPIPTLEAAGGL